MKTPFLGSAYVARSVNVADNRMVNLFPEIVHEGGKETAFLNRAPGLRSLGTVGDGPVRGLCPFKDDLYVVSGSELYKVKGLPFVSAVPGSWLNAPDNCGVIAATNITGSGDITLTVTTDGKYQYTVGGQTWPDTPSPWSTIVAGSPHAFSIATLTFSASAPVVPPVVHPDLTIERLDPPEFDYSTGFWHYTYRLYHSALTVGSQHYLLDTVSTVSDVYTATETDVANGYVDILRTKNTYGSFAYGLQPEIDAVAVKGQMFLGSPEPLYTEFDPGFTPSAPPVTVGAPVPYGPLVQSVDHWVQVYRVAIDPMAVGNEVVLRQAGGYDPTGNSTVVTFADSTDLANGYVELSVNIAPNTTMPALYATLVYMGTGTGYVVALSGYGPTVDAPYLADNPVTSGLVGEWKLADASGQVAADSSGNGHDMTLGSGTGSDSNDPTWVTEGLSFDGTNDYTSLTTGTVPFADRTDYHIVAVVRETDLSTNRAILGLNAQIRFHIWGTKLELGAYVGATATWATLNTPTLATNTWYFTEGWRDSSGSGLVGVRLGHSDVATASVGSSIPSSGGSALYLGHTPDGGLYQSGKIAYVAFYDRKLTDSEATQVYNYVKGLMADRGVTI